jgi:predicted ATPase
MIRQLQLRNFKCFQQASFDFSKINLLTGINGRGKSSVLQSILLLRQSVGKSLFLDSLFINGELLSLGSFDDIRNSEISKSERIHFDIAVEDTYFKHFHFEFEEDEKNSLLAKIANDLIKTQDGELSLKGSGGHADFRNDWVIRDFFQSIHFVSADRLGPVRFVEKTNLPEFVQVGVRGENTTNILAHSDNLPIVSDALYLGNDSKSLLPQTEAWLSFILDGAKVDIRGKEKESSVLYMLLNSRVSSNAHKPTNVGFGYSYILPLIVTGLIAKPGEMIIIENPEAHLHPRAQARITEFFSRVAASGVQVFIESHSEHILNGLRVAALKPEIGVSNTDITIHYFNDNFAVDELKVETDGKIVDWPEGFFDQQEIDLSNIFKLSR